MNEVFRNRPTARRMGSALVLSGLLLATGCHSPGRAEPPRRARSSPSSSYAPATTTSSVNMTVPSTVAPTTTTAVAQRAPSAEAIAAIMRRTVLIDDAREYFTPTSEPVTIAGGGGGFLTAVVGVHASNADGHGQLVFFWHGAQFLGWDTVSMRTQVNQVRPGGDGVFRVAYADYAPADGLCCPSLPPLTVSYRFDGRRLVASDLPPGGERPADVKLVADACPIPFELGPYSVTELWSAKDNGCPQEM